MQVREAMTKRAVTVSPDDRVETVAEKIASHHIGGVFVVRGKKLLGEINRQDVFDRIFPSYREFYDDLVHSINFEQVQHRARELAGLQARDIMNPPVMTVNPEDHVMKVAAWMQLREINRVPVMDSLGNFCGVVTKSDIFNRAISPELAAVAPAAKA